MTPDPIKSVHRARAKADDANAALRAAVVDAVNAGAAVSHVAEAAGVTRPTVYAWMRGDAER